MSGSAGVRATAAGTVAAVVGGESLQTALPVRRAGQADSARAGAQHQALVYGTLRWYVRLDAVLNLLLERPLKPRDKAVRALMLVGLFDLAYGHTPPHAAVDETVKACAKLRRQKMRGLVNAVLRRFLREQAGLQREVDLIPHVRAAHPRWLYEQLALDWPDDLQAIVAANNEHPPMWLRVNRRRTDTEEFRQRLVRKLSIDVIGHHQANAALRLARPVPVTELPGFGDGLVSVQDAAPQLAAPLLDVQPGQRVLDACAAPGGKTAHLAELGDDTVELLALDINEERLQRVNENLARLRLENVRVVAGDALCPADWWDDRPFDRILVDAPCSATGVIRRHPDIRVLRRAADIPEFARTQGRMLAALWPLLGNGGRLVYATCSVLRAENEQVLGEFLGNHSDAVDVTAAAGMRGRTCVRGMQLLPGETATDGFYYACLEKRG